MKMASEKEQLLLVHALLMTEYLDRRPRGWTRSRCRLGGPIWSRRPRRRWLAT